MSRVTIRVRHLVALCLVLSLSLLAPAGAAGKALPSAPAGPAAAAAAHHPGVFGALWAWIHHLLGATPGPATGYHRGIHVDQGPCVEPNGGPCAG